MPLPPNPNPFDFCIFLQTNVGKSWASHFRSRLNPRRVAETPDLFWHEDRYIFEWI